MNDNCESNQPSLVEVKVTSSECPAMPAGDILILEGPAINYEKSGAVCLTALNAIYPWVIATRFNVETDVLDYDAEAGCYHAVCPCGTVTFDIRNLRK